MRVPGNVVGLDEDQDVYLYIGGITALKFLKWLLEKAVNHINVFAEKESTSTPYITNKKSDVKVVSTAFQKLILHEDFQDIKEYVENVMPDFFEEVYNENADFVQLEKYNIKLEITRHMS